MKTQAKKINQILSTKTITLNDFILAEHQSGMQLNDNDNYNKHGTISMRFITIPQHLYFADYEIDDIIWNQHTILDVKKSIQRKYQIKINNQQISINCKCELVEPEDAILDDDQKLCDIEIIDSDGQVSKYAGGFSIKIIDPQKIHNDEAIIPIFIQVLNELYYDDEPTKQDIIRIFNTAFPHSISLVLYEYAKFEQKQLFFVNENHQIATDIIQWDDASLFMKELKPRHFIAEYCKQPLDWNKTFKEQYIRRESVLYLHFYENINVQIRMPYFYDNIPLILSLPKRTNMKELEQAILEHFENDQTVSQIIEQYKAKFRGLMLKLSEPLMSKKRKLNNNQTLSHNNSQNESKNNSDKIISVNRESTKKRKYAQMTNEVTAYSIDEFEVKLQLEFKAYPERLPIDVSVRNIIASQERLRSYTEPNLMNHNEQDVIFAIPRWPTGNVKLVLINDERGVEYYIIDANLCSSCLNLYYMCANKLNVDVTALLLFIKDSNNKIIIDCNVHKSVENYSMFTDSICIYYQLIDKNSIETGNKLKQLDYCRWYSIWIDNRGSKFTLKVLSSFTFKDVKEKIHCIYDIAVDRITLRSQQRWNTEFDDDSTLNQCNIKSSSKIFLRIS